MGRRVLFTTPAGLGHTQPMVPLMRAMAARGHDVLCAVPPDGIDHVEQAGILTVSVGTAGLTRPAEVLRRYPEFQSLPPTEIPNVLFAKLFGATAAPVMLADLVPLAHEWRPDLVVTDAGEFAGHIVAAELGVPSVTKGFGPLLPEPRVASGGEEVAPLWRSRGLEPRPYGGMYDHLYIDIYPPTLQEPAVAHVPQRQLLRPVTDDGRVESSSPAPLPNGSPEAPLVYLTMGTVFNDPEPLRVIVGALAEYGIRVLVTVGPKNDPASGGAHQPNVRFERYVPQSLVLSHCAVVVSHAGSGTVLATLDHGLPQLCLPQGADQFLNAAAVASAGAGLALLPGEVTPEAVVDAVPRLLDDPSFRGAARAISDSIAAMPSPDDVAAVLETLSTGQPLNDVNR